MHVHVQGSQPAERTAPQVVPTRAVNEVEARVKAREELLDDRVGQRVELAAALAVRKRGELVDAGVMAMVDRDDERGGGLPLTEPVDRIVREPATRERAAVVEDVLAIEKEQDRALAVPRARCRHVGPHAAWSQAARQDGVEGEKRPGPERTKLRHRRKLRPRQNRAMLGPMPFEHRLGHTETLRILRFGSPGAYLGSGGPKEDDVLLLGPEIPEGAKEGDELEVFLYLDSEGRPLATTRKPKLELGEVTFLTVTELTQFGSFVDWGLPKELLVPFAEQTIDMNVGGRYAVGLYLDKTGRLAGTMRVSEMLEANRREKTQWALDEWVEGEAWRNEPAIGLFVIVERAYVGLVPSAEPHGLARGEAARFRISNILADNKIELSLRGHAHEELEGDAARVLDVLRRPDAEPITEKASPDDIRDRFGLSKKAFKRAVGRLLKDRVITIDDDGVLRPGTR